MSSATKAPGAEGPGDWVLVPREPTPEMLKAGYDAYAAAEWDQGRAKRGPERESLPIAYRALIASAPAPSDPAGAGGTWLPMKDAPTGVPIIAKHKPNAAMPHGWVATIKLGHGDDEEAGCYDTILHYNGEESFRGFRGTWTGWLPVGSALPAGAGGDLRAAAQAVFDAINADGPGVGEPGYPDDPAYNLEDKGRMRLTTGLVRRLHDALASTPGKKGAGEAIKFAVGIDDHYDRLEFLQSWLSGDTSEWPEFIQTPPSPPSATPEGDPPMTVEEAELFPRGCGSGTYFRRLPDNSWVMLNSSSQWVTVPKFSAEIDANGAAIAAIKFALTIDDHYDRLDFLRDWIKGDVSEWPEFAPTESPSTKEASDA